MDSAARNAGLKERMTRTLACDRLGIVCTAAMTALIVACGRGKEPPKTPLSEGSVSVGAPPPSSMTGDTRDLPLDAGVALDSGNALFRAKRYPEALAQYRVATRRAPDDAAAYFGIYMVASATKNQTLADTALAAMRARGMTAPAGPHLPPIK